MANSNCNPQSRICTTLQYVIVHFDCYNKRHWSRGTRSPKLFINNWLIFVTHQLGASFAHNVGEWVLPGAIILYLPIANRQFSKKGDQHDAGRSVMPFQKGSLDLLCSRKTCLCWLVLRSQSLYSRHLSLVLRLLNVTSLIPSNKTYHRKSMQVVDEKIIINQLGPYTKCTVHLTNEELE